MKIILETERLILREFAAADIDDLALVLCDRENMRFYPDAFERQHVQEWIERNKRRYEQGDGIGLWAMILKADARLIGDCGLIPQVIDGFAETEIGYHLRREYQGRGYATEAARACREYGFAKLGRSRLISLIRPENVPSRRVAERNGMVIEKETIFHDLLHLVYVVTSFPEI